MLTQQAQASFSAGDGWTGAARMLSQSPDATDEQVLALHQMAIAYADLAAKTQQALQAFGFPSWTPEPVRIDHRARPLGGLDS